MEHERGAIAAEHLATMVLVAALIRRPAVDCRFDPPCELPERQRASPRPQFAAAVDGRTHPAPAALNAHL